MRENHTAMPISPYHFCPLNPLPPLGGGGSVSKWTVWDEINERISWRVFILAEVSLSSVISALNFLIGSKLEREEKWRNGERLELTTIAIKYKLHKKPSSSIFSLLLQVGLFVLTFAWSPRASLLFFLVLFFFRLL
jgi:hypothetical protein